jgi:hypothetical protein
MRSLREPVSSSESAQYLIFALAAFAALHWAGEPLGIGQWLAMWLVLGFVIYPFSVLVHELGHALAVTWLGKRSARLVVGRPPWFEVRIGRLDLRFSPLPTRGVTFNGICLYEPTGLSWRSLGWITLAGPLATLLELIAVLGTSPVLWHVGPLVRALVILTAGALLVSLVGNLSGERVRAGHGKAVVGQRDGWIARQAFALHRKGAPPPRRTSTPGPTATL